MTAQSAPQAVGVGGDNLTRLLWNNPDGSVSLWRLNADASVTAYTYGPFSGWRAQSLTVGTDNVSRILWDNTSGYATVWDVNNQGINFNANSENAYSIAGYAAAAVAVGPRQRRSRSVEQPQRQRAALEPERLPAYPGPGMTGSFVYSDTAGLTIGAEYFYIVWAVQGGVQTVQSDEASDTPQANAVPWDAGNAAQIVSQVEAIVPNNLASDEPAVGELTIGGPNGVIYQSFQDGSTAQAYAAPGYYAAGPYFGLC